MEGERRVDNDVRARLEEIEAGYIQRADQNRSRIDHLTKWTFILLAIIVAVQLAFGVISVYLISQNADRQADIKHTVTAIQEQRIESIWDGCRSQNFRHDETISRLNVLVDAITDPVRKARAKASLEGTVSLIDALAPHQNCIAVLRLRFGFSKDKAFRTDQRLRRELGPPSP